VPLDGYQMRYIYFLNPDARARLACKEIPYAEIERRGAGMYRGLRVASSVGRGPLGTAARQRRPPRSILSRHRDSISDLNA
jgi:hypothetical protein